jgi:hypothetical protein
MSAEKVDKTKYGKYLKSHPVGQSPFGPVYTFSGEDDFQSGFSMFVIAVDRPNLMEETPHSHDFDMYLIFCGMDPANMGDLGAEIEFYFGEEKEKHVITTPTTIYIPKGMVHCPLNFKRVDKPVLFLHATIAPRYKK